VAAGNPQAVVALQRAAGNRAVAAVLRSGRRGRLQRQAKAPAVEDDGPLRSCILASDGLQDAARNSPTLKQGAHNVDVASVQFGLRRIGMPLERSFPDGLPDGKYGLDTAENLRQFQVDEGIDPPGGFEVGKRTLHHLDARILKDGVDQCDTPPKPDPNPDPKPPPAPSVNVTCPDTTKAAAIRAGVVDGKDTLAKANARFFSDKKAARDAAFLFFRSRDDQILQEASRNMQQAAAGILNVEYRCMENGQGACTEDVGGFSFNFSRVVVLCPLYFKPKTNRARVIVHENMHMAGLQRPGLVFDPEHSLQEDPFFELEPELSVADRIRNADHNAGFAVALASKSSAELARAAAHRAGGDLRVVANGSGGSIPAKGPVPRLLIAGDEDRQVGLSDNQVWTVTDNGGQPVRVTPLPERDEAVLSQPERDRLVAAVATSLHARVDLDVSGTGPMIVVGVIPIDLP
jgi:hypothetical protein